MAVANEKPAATALLILSFFFIPAVLIASRPFGDLTLAAATACGLMCVGLARLNWSKFSRLSIASITNLGRRTK